MPVLGILSLEAARKSQMGTPTARLPLEDTFRQFSVYSGDFLLAHAFKGGTAASSARSRGMGPNGTGPCRFIPRIWAEPSLSRELSIGIAYNP